MMIVVYLTFIADLLANNRLSTNCNIRIKSNKRCFCNFQCTLCCCRFITTGLTHAVKLSFKLSFLIVEFFIICFQRQNWLKLVILCEFLYIEIKTFPENPHFNQYYKIMLICTVIKSEGTIVWHGFELAYSINLVLNWFWVS